MPYRGLERTGPACYRHAAASATETCARCLRPMCEICVGFEDTRPHCPSCARRAQKVRRLRHAAQLVAIVALASASFGALGVLLGREAPPVESAVVPLRVRLVPFRPPDEKLPGHDD